MTSPREQLAELRAKAEAEAAYSAKAQAKAAAQRELQNAARFAMMHATSKALLSKSMGTGKAARLVRMEWPGVLVVLDPATGRELARSEPGQPAELAASFEPLAGRHS